MGTSPALRIARSSVQVGVAQSPARATPTKVAAGPTSPAGLPPSFFALAPGFRYMSDMRILIIEDDRDAAAYLAKAFKRGRTCRRPGE